MNEKKISYKSSFQEMFKIEKGFDSVAIVLFPFHNLQVFDRECNCFYSHCYKKHFNLLWLAKLQLLGSMMEIDVEYLSDAANFFLWF